MEILLDRGADVNAKTAKGHTVLYYAVAHRHIEAVKLLLARGVDAGAELPYGKTALQWAQPYADQDPDVKPIVDLLQDHEKNQTGEG
jgi:ankyrin repeat protein